MLFLVNDSSKQLPGAWPTAKVIEVLATAIAMAAMRGRPSPVAAAVLERLENSK